MAIKEWHYGKLVILWAWATAVAGFSFHLLESVEDPTIGFMLIGMSLGIPLAMSFVTWKWLSGMERPSSPLQLNAERLRVESLLEDVAEFVAAKLPGSRQHPSTCSYTYTLADTTQRHRTVVDVCLDHATPGRVFLQLHKYAVELAGPLLESFTVSNQGFVQEDDVFQTITVEIAPDRWASISEQLAPAFSLMLDKLEALAQSQCSGENGADKAH